MYFPHPFPHIKFNTRSNPRPSKNSLCNSPHILHKTQCTVPTSSHPEIQCTVPPHPPKNQYATPVPCKNPIVPSSNIWFFSFFSNNNIHSPEPNSSTRRWIPPQYNFLLLHFSLCSIYNKGLYAVYWSYNIFTHFIIEVPAQALFQKKKKIRQFHET